VDIVPDTYSVGGPVAPSRGCGGKKILVIRWLEPGPPALARRCTDEVVKRIGLCVCNQ
jgi:hypothetical protein